MFRTSHSTRRAFVALVLGLESAAPGAARVDDGGVPGDWLARYTSARREFLLFIAFAQISPTSANRAGAVSIVNSRGSRSSVSSSQSRGVETMASALARAEYAPATVLPMMFWR